MNELKFELRTKRIPVTISNEDGTTVVYNLCEMPAGEREQFLDQTKPNFNYDSAGKVIGLKKLEGAFGDLVSRCLVDADGKRVTKETIQKWPSSMVVALYTECQKLNNLTKDADEEIKEAKNG